MEGMRSTRARDIKKRYKAGEVQLVEVHNAWTIYGVNEDGSEAEEKIACLERPQDWGDPRWHYDLADFGWVFEGKLYVNHVHMWTDVKRDSEAEYLALFAGLFVQICMPGMDRKWCGDEFLADEDFWSEEWGEMPPFANGDEPEEE